MLLLFLQGASSAPAPPATNYDQYLLGAATAHGALSTDTDVAETSSTLSTLIEGYEAHGQPLRTDI